MSSADGLGSHKANLRAPGRAHLDVVYLRQHELDSLAEHDGALAELRQAG